MHQFSVKISKLRENATDLTNISVAINNHSTEINNIISQLDSAIQQKVSSTLKTISVQLDEQAKDCKKMGTQLNVIADCYAGTENKIVQGDIFVKAFHASKSTIDAIKATIEGVIEKITSIFDVEPINPDELSYDEYLEYRANHAVDENTRKLYEKYQKKIKIKDDDYDGTAHYHPVWNHINYNVEEDNVDERGRGSTYFHEVGHLIDDKSDLNSSTSTDWSYDFYKKLDKDLDNYINKIMKENGYTNKQDAYDDLTSWLWDDPDMKSGVSDLVNGLTDGEACGRWSHSDDYYNKSSIANEAFAHFFEAGMSTDSTKLDYIKEIFPSAYEEYQKMITDELK